MSCILYFPGYQSQAQQLAQTLALPCSTIKIHRFPDQESRVTVPLLAQQHAIIYCGLEHPNNKLIELLLSVETLKKQGMKKFSLVAPYLCYMRQDMAFQTGEAISQHIIGRYLGDLFDDILSVDAHLHRTTSLAEVFPDTNTCHLSATGLFSDYLQQQDSETILLGPDEESLQWVSQIAEKAQLPYLIARKHRHGDHEVSITLPEHDFKNRTVILVDDIISSGGTIMEISQQLKQAGVTNIRVLVTHALYEEQAMQKFIQAGIDDILSSNTIPHPSNHLDIVPSIAAQVKHWID